MKLRKLFVLVASLALVVLLAGCNNKEKKNQYTYQEVSNPSEVVFSNDKVSVTKGEIYEMIRYTSGLNAVLQQIDEHILASYIEKVDTTSESYTKAKNELIYSTTDEDEIAKIMLDTEENQKLQKDFEYTLVRMGMTEEEYVKFLVAHEVLVKELLEENHDNDESTFFVGEPTLESFYNSSYYDEAKAVIIDFTSANEYRNTLKSLGYVIYKSEIRKYTGSTPLSDLSERKLSDDNTQALESSEVLDLFVSLYNKVYESYKAAVTSSTIGNTYTYKDLSSSSATLAKKVFTMAEGDYTYTTLEYSVGYGKTNALIYRLDGEERAEYKDLTDEEKALVLAKYIENVSQNSSFQNLAMIELRKENNLTWYDKFFATDYATRYDSTLDVSTINGDKEKIASIDGLEITADSLYTFCTEKNIENFVVFASQLKLAQTSAFFKEVYGTETDMTKNESKRKAYYVEQLDKFKESYDENTYKTVEDYCYQSRGLTSYDDILYKYYITSDANTLLAYDLIFSQTDTTARDAKVQEIIDDLYDNYYSLKAHQVIVSVDYNNDYKLDDFAYTLEHLSEFGVTATKEQIETSLGNLYSMIKEIAEAETTLTKAATAVKDFIAEYNAASILDAKYGEFKKLGFKIQYSAINSGNEIQYSTYKAKANEDIHAALKGIFSQIVEDDNLVVYSASAMVNDENGSHFIFAGKASKTTVPSYKYEATETDNASANNPENEKPSVQQVVGAYQLAFLNSIFTNSETASDKFDYTNYPIAYPKSLDLSSYTDALDDYYLTENFVNVWFCNELGYTDLAGIYSFYLNN